MKKALYSLVSLLLVCVMVLGTAVFAVAEDARPKVVILTSINVDTEGTDVNDNDYINYIRDTIGVDIEFINDGTNQYRQKMNTMLASIPAAGMYSRATTSGTTAVNDGALTAQVSRIGHGSPTRHTLAACAL